MEHGVKAAPRSIGALLLAMGLSVAPGRAQAMITTAAFGQADGQPVAIYTLTNSRGIEVRVMTFGASIVSLKTPDRHGRSANIVLGFDALESYVAGVPYFGATVGRYANRIAGARFSLDGATYRLVANDGPNTLHGGRRGFDKHIWTADSTGGPHSNRVRMTYISADGEEGFPGAVTAHATYSLGDDDTLEILYEATTTAPTPINLANHSYFNLSGDPQRSILDHRLVINADKFTPVDSRLIPNGVLLDVARTPFDFRSATPIGARIDVDDEQLRRGHGYDHNWVLRAPKGRDGLRLAAVLSDPDSGRVLEIRTTQPGLQFYSGNFMDGKPAGEGSVYRYRTGLCLETQHFPDSPNRAAFPSTTLRPGEIYLEKTRFHFIASASSAN